MAALGLKAKVAGIERQTDAIASDAHFVMVLKVRCRVEWIVEWLLGK